jgi:predicted outer membrane protein
MKLKETIMIAIAALAFMLITGIAKADDKTITPQEFVSNVAEVPGKLVTFIGSEVEKTKEYQAKSWADMKTKWPFTMFKGKSDVTQN